MDKIHAEHKHTKTISCCLSNPFWVLIALPLGILAGYLDIDIINSTAKVIGDLFMRILKLLSLPVISFALLSTLSGLGSWSAFQKIGLKVMRYTIFTTVVSASIAALLFGVFQPKMENLAQVADYTPSFKSGDYVNQLLNLVPSNIIQPFVEHNVIGVLMIALFFGLGILSLPEEKRVFVNQFLDGIFSAIMNMIQWIVQLMPFAVFAFVVQFCQDLQKGLGIDKLAIYIALVVGANLIQAFLVLPFMLTVKGIPAKRTFMGMFKALYFAFTTKSSAAAMPVAMSCAESLGADSKIIRFSFPLCTTINMNACAAFIYITYMFVATSHGIKIDFVEQIVWIFIATIAAIGNAGVPMGCFFLASALLTAQGVPIMLMGVILPVYALIDMLESAINIWSDSCVTLMVDKDLKEE